MANAKPKETSVPLICALVLFILTTIAFGVMWYTSLAEIETAKANEKKATDEVKLLRTARDTNELKYRVVKAWVGVDDAEDKPAIKDSPDQATVSAELIKLNEAAAKRLGVPDVTSVSEEFRFWKTDANRKAEIPPAEGVLDQVAKLNKKEVAYKAADEERKAYREQIEGMKVAISGLDKLKAEFKNQINALPQKFQDDLKKILVEFDRRTDLYKQQEAAANLKLQELANQRDDLQTRLGKMEKSIAALQENNQQLQAKARSQNQETFTYDEPQGKILRKLPEGVVEINLGSAANVRPGLTFTVLPPDFQEKGRQSRVRKLRVPDGRGGYTSVESFVPRGSIEVYEVLGPNLARARVQAGSELDPIRDGVAVGDLIYNSVWRKGVADHIALVGIFDINGDGSDDIEAVVKDLTKMGIPVDAYYDIKNRKWIGQVTERTRYIVEGYYPIQSAQDPNREEKTKLIGQLSAAVAEGRAKGVNSVNFRDFFSRMGYKFRLDVSDDKINQATAPYLNSAGLGSSPLPTAPPAPNP